MMMMIKIITDANHWSCSWTTSTE